MLVGMACPTLAIALLPRPPLAAGLLHKWRLAHPWSIYGRLILARPTVPLTAVALAVPFSWIALTIALLIVRAVTRLPPVGPRPLRALRNLPVGPRALRARLVGPRLLESLLLDTRLLDSLVYPRSLAGSLALFGLRLVLALLGARCTALDPHLAILCECRKRNPDQRRCQNQFTHHNLPLSSWKACLPVAMSWGLTDLPWCHAK